MTIIKDDEMLKKWKRIRRHLELAGEKVDNSLRANQLYKDYENFLNHNEFELSMDSLLEMVEESNFQTNESKWILNYLCAASEEMGLAKSTNHIRGLITTLEDRGE